MSSPSIEDLFDLTLVDGLPATRDGKTIRYNKVRLRETNVADERAAVRLAERVVLVQGAPQLLCSQADFRFAMTLQHIERLECPGIGQIGRTELDLDLLGRLSAHDLRQIEERIFLIELAAQLRYGAITQAEFDQVVRGQAGPAADTKAAAPQPQGQAADAGAHAAQPESGPALLADLTGHPADGPAARLGS